MARYYTLPAKLADSVDFKDGLMNNRVCTVKFPVVGSYFYCNTTHTELHCLKALRKDGPGHQSGWTWRFGDAQVLLFRSPS